MTDRTEFAITGHRWKDCPRCPAPAVRILVEATVCQRCGGPMVNCPKCQTGKDWWRRVSGGYVCPVCATRITDRQAAGALANRPVISASGPAVSAPGDYWRDLAEVRRKRVNRLAVALMVVCVWLAFTGVLQLWATFR